MKRIVIADENIAFFEDDKIDIKFGKAGGGNLENITYNANSLTKKQIAEIKKDPKKAKGYLQDLKEIKK